MSVDLIHLKSTSNLSDFFSYLNSDCGDNYIQYLENRFGPLENFVIDLSGDNQSFVDNEGKKVFSIRLKSNGQKVHLDIFENGHARPVQRVILNEFGNVYKIRYYQFDSWEKIRDIYVDNDFAPSVAVEYQDSINKFISIPSNLFKMAAYFSSEKEIIHSAYLNLLQDRMKKQLGTKPFVSVIIATYKSANVIQDAMTSLIGQSLDKSFIEILVADDKSPDNTLAVLKDYQSRMPNLSIIELEENYGGPTGPRNAALIKANGQYVIFMDHDDFLNNETFERFATYALEWQSDVFEGRKKGVRGRNVPRSMFKFGNMKDADVIKHNLINSMAPHKLYRRKFLIQNNIKFPTEFMNGDDLLFNMAVYTYADRISILSDYDYYFVTSREDGGETLASSSTWNKSVQDILAKVVHVKNVVFNSDLNAFYKRRLFGQFIVRIQHETLKLNARDERLEAFVNGWKNQIIPLLTSDIIAAIPNTRTRWMVNAISNGGFEKLTTIRENLKHRIDINKTKGTDEGLTYLVADELINLGDEIVWSAMAKQLYLSDTELRIDVQLSNSMIDFDALSAKLVVIERETNNRVVLKGMLINSTTYSFNFNFSSIEVLRSGMLYDLYLNINFQDFTKDVRVQTNYEFSAFENTDHKIVPYATASKSLTIGMAKNDSKMADWLMKKNKQKI